MNLIYHEASIYFDILIESISKDLKLVAYGDLQLSLPHIPTSFLSTFLKEIKKLY
jgi:hypothetical protein